MQVVGKPHDTETKLRVAYAYSKMGAKFFTGDLHAENEVSLSVATPDNKSMSRRDKKSGVRLAHFRLPGSTLRSLRFHTR